MTARPFALAAAICVALAAASLLLGGEPVYDAWAWLVWGRELSAFGLDTSSGPSWKPLTVAIAAPLSLTGDLAPDLWLVFIRAAWLFSLLLAAELAWQLAGAGIPRGARIAAAAFAAISLALLADHVTMWARQAAAGMSEPLLVALVLGAVRADLARRARWALVLGGLAALVRPEVWPLLVLYGTWRWRSQPGERALVAALALAVPVLWIAPDLLASGDALAGPGRARRATDVGALDVLARAAGLPLLAAWPLAIVSLAGRERRLLVLGAGALVWIATVAAMSELLGFPGLPRFMAPAAAVAGVLGGVGLARLLAPAVGVRGDLRSASVPVPATPAAGVRGDLRSASVPVPATPAAGVRGDLRSASSPVPATPGAGVRGDLRSASSLAPATPAGGVRGDLRSASSLAPAASAASVRGGVGPAWPAPRVAQALAVAALALSAPGLAGRASELPYAVGSTARIGQSHERVRELVDAIGTDELLRCGRVATSDILVRTALAWKLEVALAEVVSFGRPPRLSGAFVLGPQASQSLEVATRARSELAASRGEWRVYSIACPPKAAAASSSPRTTGVSGARR